MLESMEVNVRPRNPGLLSPNGVMTKLPGGGSYDALDG
jgi:hypothetical protein